MELRGDDEHFKSICNMDIDLEEKLNHKLQATLVIPSAKNQQPMAAVDLSLLCLEGHIAKLEHRRSYLTIGLAMVALTLPVWAKRDLPVSLLLIGLTVLCALAMWVLISSIDKRVFVLKRTAAHLKYYSDHA